MKKFKFTNAEAGTLCRELGYLLHAGIGNADALHNLADDESRPEYKKVLESMAEQADEGAGLSECFAGAGCFEAFIGEMLNVGEQSGRTENALEAIADGCDNRAALDRSVKSALLYPMLLLLIMLTVVAVLLIYVLPIFNEVYSQLGSGLTGLAGSLLGIGKAMGKISPLLIAVFGIIVVFLALFAGNDSFRESVLNRWWKARGDKGVSGKLNSARFAQALSMGMSSGLSPDLAVREAAKVLTNSDAAAARAEECCRLLDEGSTVSSALSAAGLLPPSACRMLEAGVRGGNGETAMLQIADRLTKESDAALEESMSKIEPTMVIITSLLVGMILVAVMLPLINIMAAIG